MIELTTERLILRTPRLDDVPAITAFANDPACSWGGYGIPHPCSDEDSEAWVRKGGKKLDAEEGYAFLVCRKEDGQVMGDVQLNRDPTHNNGDIGYIIGAEYRGHGYAFEAATELLRFGFVDIELHKIHATCWAKNEQSAHILEKLGFIREGVLREHALKWGVYEDDVYYGLLRREWEANRASGQ